MTLEEFIKIMGDDLKDMPKEDVEIYYDLCVKFFNVNFNKYKEGLLNKV